MVSEIPTLETSPLNTSNTGCPKKNFLLGKIVIEASNMGQISCPRTVLKNSGSEDFKTVLT